MEESHRAEEYSTWIVGKVHQYTGWNEEQISKLEDRAFELSQTEQQKRKQNFKNEER